MPAFFRDLSLRSKLRVGGQDRVRFLNGQTTNDVRKARAEEAQLSCVVDAKGHLNACLLLFVTNEAIWIEADEKTPLVPRLERYVIADDVQIEDVTNAFGLFHLIGGERKQVPDCTFVVKSTRVGLPGYDLWVPQQRAGEVRSKVAKIAELMDESTWEVLRVESGVPRWGYELTPELIPLEADLGSAIDYEKGCYIGQEVISRMKMSGQVRQKLRGIISLEGTALTPTTHLRSNDKVVGRITSAVYSARLKNHIGLAIVKRQFNEPGTELMSDTGPVRVVALPFAAAADVSLLHISPMSDA